MLPFPPLGIAARKPKVLKEEVVVIYCQCRLPYTGRKTVQQGDGCQNGRHCDCMHAHVSPGSSGYPQIGTVPLYVLTKSKFLIM